MLEHTPGRRITCTVLATLLLAAGILCPAAAQAGPPAVDLAGPVSDLEQAGQLMTGGQHLDALLMYEQAAAGLKGSASHGDLLVDDADFGKARALEAAGQDAAALELWKQWRVDHPHSPLAVEVGLAMAWNHLRTGHADTATTLVRELVAGHPWLADDPRPQILLGAVALAAGDAENALHNLDTAARTAPLPAHALMLQGLAREALGQPFAAAMAYQEIVDNHPGSPLTGPAFMAKGRLFDDPPSYRQAAAAYSTAAAASTRGDLRSAMEYMAAACFFLGQQQQEGLAAMRAVADSYPGSDLATRAMFSLGEMRWQRGEYELAVARFNEALDGNFDPDLAGRALYRTGRCLDAMGRPAEASASYQAVAEGHPYLPEAPAAVYLAGVGFFEQDRPMEAARFFQLLLDRYAGQGARYVFADPGRQELVEAGLCLLEYSYHRAGEYGLMAGAPHQALQKMPPSGSLWRAYTLLLDADALAAVNRYPEAQATLATLFQEYPDHPVGIRANRLLAWTYAQQGRQDLAIDTEQAMLARFGAQQDGENLAGSLLTIAHAHFNAKRYEEAAAGYRRYLQNPDDQERRLTALYQEGLCYVRLGRSGDAVDTWALITSLAPASEPARKAWLRSGDILFQAAHFDDARAQYTALMENFPEAETQAAATLRLARCDHNQGRAAEALGLYRQVAARFHGREEARQAVEGITQILYATGREGDTLALEELAQKYPDSPLAPEAGFELALRVYEAGDFAAAADQFAALFARYPRYSAADRHLWFAADSQEKAGRQAQAGQSWQEFLAYFPHSDLAAGALLHLAGLRFAEGQYHGAVEDYRRVVQMPAEDEIHAAAWYNLASCLRILGETPDALDALARYEALASGDQATNDPGRDVAAARAQAEIHQEQGHLREAARQYARAIEMGATPDEAVELNYLAGLCLKEAGNMQEALKAYALAIASPDKSNTYRLSALAQTADLHEQQGRFADALTAYHDLMKNATDPALADAAGERAAQLEAALGR